MAHCRNHNTLLYIQGCSKIIGSIKQQYSELLLSLWSSESEWLRKIQIFIIWVLGFPSQYNIYTVLTAGVWPVLCTWTPRRDEEGDARYVSSGTYSVFLLLTARAGKEGRRVIFFTWKRSEIISSTLIIVKMKQQSQCAEITKGRILIVFLQLYSCLTFRLERPTFFFSPSFTRSGKYVVSLSDRF